MAKKEAVATLDVATESEAIKEAKKLILDRLPEPINGEYVFKLKQGVSWMFPPKFTFFSKTSNSRVIIRYAKTENSIFEPEQSGGPVLLEQIEVTQHMVVRDKLLASWLVLSPFFNKKYIAFDPVGDADREYEKLAYIDDVWSTVRGKNDEQKRALAVMLTKKSMAEVNSMTSKQLFLTLKHECEVNPKRVYEFSMDPVLDTLYLTSIADALKVIKYNKNTTALVWADNNREICKIPKGKDPIMYLAKLLLEDDYLKIKEELDKQTNG